MHRNIMPAAEIEPRLLGRQAAAAARIAWRRGIALIDPAAAAVAIDAGGRKIAQPFQPFGGGDIAGAAAQHRVAGFVGRNGAQHMAGGGRYRGVFQRAAGNAFAL